MQDIPIISQTEEVYMCKTMRKTVPPLLNNMTWHGIKKWLK